MRVRTITLLFNEGIRASEQLVDGYYYLQFAESDMIDFTPRRWCTLSTVFVQENCLALFLPLSRS